MAYQSVPQIEGDPFLENNFDANTLQWNRFRRFMETFTSNEIAVIAVQTDDALSTESRSIIKQLLDDVRRLEAVQKAQALADVPERALKLFGDRLTQHRLVLDNLLSRDGKTAAIMMQMAGEDHNPLGRRQTVARIRQIVRTARAEHPVSGQRGLPRLARRWFCGL